MKKTIIIGLCAIFLASCNLTQNVTTVTQQWVATHCSTQPIGGYQITKCDSLYPTGDVKKICSTAVITYDVAGASVTVKTKCLDSTDIFDLVKSVVLKKK